jgi:hypothetical protein
MTIAEELNLIADELTPAAPILAGRLRSIAWRVNRLERLERAADDIVEDARQTARNPP